MCGIVGVAYHDPSRAVEATTIQRMCDAIRHRGPDDEGSHLDGPVGLGMRRLSIIDVAGGHQPISGENDRATIVLNGEIYNYRPLQQALRARGHRFRSQGDTETVLHLYEEEGPDCVDALRGMFAFAVWDRTERTLFLARDRFGIKPLYYVEGRWGLAFASELKALLAIGASEGRLDWEGLDAYFELGYLPAPSTPFTDVRKLPPGHTLTWRPGRGIVLRQYWDLPRGTRSPLANAEARVREWIDDSVAAHLVSDVPVAALLSGGIDSSAVVSSMALQGAPPHAFTVRYQGSGAATTDETGLARRLAQRYGAELTVVDVAPQVAAILEPIAWALDEPHADDSAIPTWLLSEAVGRNYKVALAGIGGDELFAGYRRHLALRWSGWYGSFPTSVRQGIAALTQAVTGPIHGGRAHDRLTRFLAAGEGGADTRFLAMVGGLRGTERATLYSRELTPSISGQAAARLFAAHLAGAGRQDGVSAGLHLDYKTFLPDDILALSDRIAMAHGLEIRVPFVDHRLVESIHPLSDTAKVGWGRPKALLRRAIADRLPRAHLRAPKRGFVGPTASWLRNELRPLLVDELSAARIGRLGYFDPRAVDRLLEDHLQGRRDRERILWTLLCFSLWHRLYIEGRSPSRIDPVVTPRRGVAVSR